MNQLIPFLEWMCASWWNYLKLLAFMATLWFFIASLISIYKENDKSEKM